MSKDNHIIITDKNRCSGCAACMSACPKQCISMQEDEEGFLYPHVDENTCISCSKCVTVCPYTKSEFTNKLEKEELAICYAAYNKNEEIRYQSSSGGMFRAFSDYIIAEGGVVLEQNLIRISLLNMLILRLWKAWWISWEVNICKVGWGILLQP